MNMVNVNIKYSPADKDPLPDGITGESCVEEWDYRSIFEILLYLAGSTHLDISYAVH